MRRPLRNVGEKGRRFVTGMCPRVPEKHWDSRYIFEVTLALLMALLWNDEQRGITKAEANIWLRWCLSLCSVTHA